LSDTSSERRWRKEQNVIDDGHRLKCFSNPQVFTDENALSFCIERRDGQSLQVVCDLPELGDVFSFLGMLAKSTVSNRDSPEEPPDIKYLAPIPCDGMGFQPGTEPDTTMLVVRLSGFLMAFSMANSELGRVASGFARIAQTLYASDHQRQ
jgi:hypothetical protein